MLHWLIAMAEIPGYAAPPEPEPAPAPPDPVIQELEQAVEKLSAELAASQAAEAAAEALQARSEALVAAIIVLLDDRQTPEARAVAADLLRGSGDPRIWPVLWSCSLDRQPDIQRLCAETALQAGPQGLDIASRVLRDDISPHEPRMAVVTALGVQQSDAAADLLYEASEDRKVPVRVRTAAVRTLEGSYPEWLAQRGGPPAVVDPLGGLLFIGANGLASAIVFSSLGFVGESDEAGGPALGAVAGTAIGLGGAALYVSRHQLTLGQGMAYASGASWGLTWGLWATTATSAGHHLREGRAGDPPAAWRATGMLLGAGMGVWAMSYDPRPVDVLEVNTAGYLASAVALGTTALVGYRAPVQSTPTGITDTLFMSTAQGQIIEVRPEETEAQRYERAARERHALVQLGGSAVGLAGGVWLAEHWTMQPQDVLFAMALGGQGLYLGSRLPALVGAEPSRLEGYVRLPWNGSMALGFLLAEIQPMTPQRTASLAWGSTAGDMLGAGLPMLAGYDDPRSIAAWTMPMGILGAAGGILAHPRVQPTVGDWTLTATGTSIALGQGALLGQALDDLGVWADSGQGPGLALTASGSVGAVLYGLGGALEPRIDHCMLLTSAAGWGALYGGLAPLALRTDPRPSTSLLSAFSVSVAATGGLGLAAAAGLPPRDTFVPQLLGGAGATIGSLSTAASRAEPEDVALGTLSGATLGLLIGTGYELLADPTPARSRRLPRVRLPGTWLPVLESYPGADGGMVPVAGVRAVGW